MAQSRSSSKDSVAVLQFQLQRIKRVQQIREKQWLANTESKNFKIQSLEAATEDLKEKLNIYKAKMVELEAKLKKSEAESEKKSSDISMLAKLHHRERAGLVKRAETAEKKAKVSQESVTKTVSELKLKHKSELSELQKDCEDKQRRALTDAEKRYIELTSMLVKDQNHTRDQLQSEINKYKNAVEESRQALQEKEEEMSREDMKYRRLDNSHYTLKNKAEKMEKRLKIKDDLIEKVYSLEETLNTVKRDLENKTKELTDLQKEHNQIHFRHRMEIICKDKAQAELQTELKCFTDKLSQTQDELEKTKREMNSAKIGNIHLSEAHQVREDAHKMKLNSHMSALAKEREKNRTLTNELSRFKEDLQKCMRHISDVNMFKKSVVAVKKQYIDKDVKLQKKMDKMDADSDTEDTLKDQVHNLKRELHSCHVINRNTISQLKREQKTQEKQCQKHCSTTREHLTIINEQQRKIDELEEQLREMKEPLTKATKSKMQRAKSWLKKKLLPKPQVIQPQCITDLIKITPLRPPSDSQPSIVPQHPSFNYVSDVLPCEDHVIPFEDGMMPPVIPCEDGMMPPEIPCEDDVMPPVILCKGAVMPPVISCEDHGIPPVDI